MTQKKKRTNRERRIRTRFFMKLADDYIHLLELKKLQIKQNKRKYQ